VLHRRRELLQSQRANTWTSGFLTAGPEEGRSFFPNVLFLVFYLVLTMEKVLKEYVK
jgi:hypothetical protein